MWTDVIGGLVSDKEWRVVIVHISIGFSIILH